MDSAEIMQEKKDHRGRLEQQLRNDGQKLDALWLQARNAVGQARIDLHKQIKMLREQQGVDRKVHDALKSADTMAATDAENRP